MKQEEVKVIGEDESFTETEDDKVVRVVTITKKKTEVSFEDVTGRDFMPASIAKEMEITSEEIQALGEILKEDIGIKQNKVQKVTEFEEEVKEVLTDDQKIDYLMNKMYKHEEKETQKD